MALFPSAYIAPTCSSKSKSLQCLVKDTLVALAWPAQNHVTCWRSFNLFLASLFDFGAALVTLKTDFLLSSSPHGFRPLFLSFQGGVTLAVLLIWVFFFPTPRICFGKDSLASQEGDHPMPKERHVMLSFYG